MGNRKRPASNGFLDPKPFCEQVFEWLEDFAPLFEGLAFVRQLDGEADAADALAMTRPLTSFRVSWELWEALVTGDGDDPDALLEPLLGDDLLGWMRFTLWGVPLRAAPPTLTVVQNV